VKKRDEQRGADDRPHDRKRLAVHVEHKRLGQVELTRNPWAEQGADETERDGHDEPASRSASERLADSAADGCDDD